MRRNFYYICITLALLSAGALHSQEIRTAENFFDRMAEVYGEIRDYIANVTITQDRDTMRGVLQYKSPNLLRIDFSSPAEQVLITDGTRLTVYIPLYRVVMTQALRRRSAASLATRQGLAMLRRNYSIAYLERPGLVPLSSSSSEMVTKLKLTWRISTEGFREMILSVNNQNMIRRIEAVTVGYQRIELSFEDIRVNQNIPDARFRYDAPATANIQENFLFEPE